MPIRIKTDLEWGQSFYVKNDPDQYEHKLVGIVIVPPNQLKFRLSYLGDVFELFDFECSTTKDINKTLDIPESEEE